MSGGHPHGLLVHRDSAIHRLTPECKVLLLLGTVIAVAITPREAMWVFALNAAFMLLACAHAGVGASYLLRRLAVGIPFFAFALFLPFLGSGEVVGVLGVTVYTEGLWAAWNVIAKAVLGLTASVLLAATTPMTEILRGLERLRAPRVMIAIAGFMIRYADVVTGEMKRMNIARAARGHNPRWFWQVKAIAGSAGTLFVRSYERGERVYVAMLSRGFSGTLPPPKFPAAARYEWFLTSLWLAFAFALSLIGWLSV